MSEECGDTELDPRIQVELEKLNTTTDEINKLELEYDVSQLLLGAVLATFCSLGGEHHISYAAKRIHAEADGSVEKIR